METAQRAHDLFLLMLSLSQVRQRQRILELFLEAINSTAPGDIAFRLLDGGEESAGRVLTIATPRHDFGRLVVEGDLTTHPEAFLALLHNAVGMLAVILENRMQAELLADENVRLEAAVKERTLALRETNAQLRDEITNRQRLLSRIQEQARQVQQIIDTVPEGVILLGTQGRVMRVNPMGGQDLEVLAGIEVGSRLVALGGRPLADLLSPPPQGLWHELVVQGRIFQVLARPLDKDGVSDGWVLVVRDVTQQREAQHRIEQQERLAAVGQLAAGIAHDFNNVMAAIVLYAQIVERSPELTSSNRARLRVINQRAQHAADLIDQILDFSRSAVMERHLIDLVPLLKEQVKLLRRTFPENIKVTLTPEPSGEPSLVNADPTRIRQMVMNLALNARDAMPSGGQLEIRLDHVTVARQGRGPLPELGPGVWVCMTISDTGSGIVPDVLSHIYEPFVTTKAPGKGSGLGLAQVHGIVKLHDGEIDVATQVGVGTSFMIYLPQAADPTPMEGLAKKELSFTVGAGQHIVMVEDNASTREVLVDSLELLNYQVLAFVDGLEALDYLSHTHDPVDLVVSDVVMPRMGGLALLRALRQEGKDVPVILLTGHPLEETLDGVSDTRNVRWMLKPLNLAQLADLVADVLG